MRCPVATEHAEAANSGDACGMVARWRCPAVAHRIEPRRSPATNVVPRWPASSRGGGPLDRYAPPAVLGLSLGTPVEDQSVLEGERKMVTALFVDIID